MGMTAAIAKPFNPLELADQIAEALGWSLENRMTYDSSSGNSRVTYFYLLLPHKFTLFA